MAACPRRPPGVPEWPKPVLGHEASRNAFCRSGTGFGVPRRQSAVQSGGEASQNGIGAGRHGERRASTRSLDPVHAVSQHGHRLSRADGSGHRWEAKIDGVRRDGGRAGPSRPGPSRPLPQFIHRPVPFDTPARRPKPSSHFLTRLNHLIRRFTLPMPAVHQQFLSMVADDDGIGVPATVDPYQCFRQLSATPKTQNTGRRRKHQNTKTQNTDQRVRQKHKNTVFSLVFSQN